jgi:hypothetical protein
MNHWILVLGWVVTAFGIVYNWQRMLLGLSETGRANTRRIARGSYALFDRANFTDGGWRNRNIAFSFALFWILIGLIWMFLSVRAQSA